MLKVGIDARTLARRNPRGIGRYVGNIIRHICEITDDIHFHLFYDIDQIKPDLPISSKVCLVPFRFRGDRWRLWERVGLPLAARRAAVDILHCPANTAASWQPIPTVITVHDTILWDNPSECGLKRHFADGPLVRSLRRAKALITISQASQKDILDRFPWAVEKLTVIPHGISESFSSPNDPEMARQMRKKFGLTGRYILYVGGVTARKRANWALRLFKEWRIFAPMELKLAMLGFTAETAGNVIFEANRLGVADHVRILPAVPEKLMPALYLESEFLVFPSLREGFGFPPLEAQACGRPILASNSSSLPEVCGPAATLLDPEDFQAWKNAGMELLQNGIDKEKSEESRNWAARFSWPIAAQKTLAVYRRIAENLQ